MKPERSAFRRIAALLLALLILILFAATLLVGIFGGSSSLPLLRVLIFSDVVSPAVIYGYLLIIRHSGRDR